MEADRLRNRVIDRRAFAHKPLRPVLPSKSKLDQELVSRIVNVE
jgi:hypothetical protein